MLHSLPLFHRIAGQQVIVLGEGAAAQAKLRLVERAGGVCVGEDNPDARLAFVALDQPEDAAARLKARGVLVNVVDRPDLCDFTVPSLLERGPVLVAVGTGGVSAGLAKALRLRLEAMLPDSLGALAAALGAARQRLRGRWSDPVARRTALDGALAAGGPLDPLRDFDARRLDQWLGEGIEAEPAAVAEIRLHSGDPDDLTLREARLLGSADLILYDLTVPEAVLNRARADAERRPASQPGGPTTGRTVVIRRD